MKGQKYYTKGIVEHIVDPLNEDMLVDAFIDDYERDDVIANICKHLPIGTKVSITVEVLDD